MSATTIRKTANAQVQRMQDEIEAVVRDSIAPTVAEIVARAASSAMYGSNQVRGYSDTVAGSVRSRPLISVLVAAIVGFVAGRTTAGTK